MKLLERGVKLIELSLVTLVFAIVFWDAILALAAAALVAPIVLDYIRLVHAVNNYIRVAQTERVVRMVHGEAASTSIIVDLRYRCRARVFAEGFSTFPEEVSDIGKHEVKVILERPSPGSYSLRSVRVAVRSGLELVEVYREFPVNVTFRVYPATTIAIAKALRVLSTMYEVGGEATVERSSRRGTEYYCTREYVEGEPLSVIDWKATARHLRIYVKEFCSEVGTSDFIVFDASSSDKLALDLVQASVVTTLLDSALEGRRVSVAVIESDGLRILSRDVSGIRGLKIVITYILSRAPQILPELEELLDPVPYRYTLKLLQEYSSIAKVFEEKVKDIRLVVSSSSAVPRIYSSASESAIVLTLCAEARAVGKQPTVYVVVGERNVVKALKLLKTLATLKVPAIPVRSPRQALRSSARIRQPLAASATPAF